MNTPNTPLPVTKAFRLALSLALIVLLAGCGSSIKIQSDHDNTADFSAYQTYQWMPQPDKANLETGLAGPIIKRSVESELNDRSMQQVQSNPDLYVVYHAGVEEKITGASVDRWGYGYGRYYGGWGSTNVTVQSYNQGTLVLDFIDAGKKELVWRGTASGAVNNPQKTREKIPQIIADLMADFPPGGGM